ncbi:MAG TPA: SGNH/GDSL hydrolase family protein [Gemmatimonadales bacterium]|nr:SGNH/GDSL hydrolase family protein [Gemmatimonadales bacterium]
MKRIVLLVLGFIVAAELVLRIPPVWNAVTAALPQGPGEVETLLKRPGGVDSLEFVRDPELGNRPRPSRTDTVHTPDFDFVVMLDSAGFPNREPWPNPADLAVLGNSLVVGEGVGIERGFSTLVAHRLGTDRAVNFGLGGASPEHQLRIYHRYVAQLHPKVVLAVIWVASDVTNAFNFQRWLASGSGQNFLEYRTSGQAKATPDRSARLASSIRGSSRLLRVAAGLGVGWKRQHGSMPERVPLTGGDTLYLSRKTEEALAEGMQRPGLPDLARVFFGPLDSLRQAVETDHGQLFVVLLPSKEELYAARAYPPVLRAADAVRRGLDSLHIATIDLYRPMEAGMAGGVPFFTRDIHFTVYGNRVVGDALADSLQARGVSFRH